MGRRRGITMNVYLAIRVDRVLTVFGIAGIIAAEQAAEHNLIGFEVALIGILVSGIVFALGMMLSANKKDEYLN